MAIQSIKRESVRLAVHIDGEPLYGLMATMSPNSQAGAFTIEELNEIVQNHSLSFVEYIPKDKDFSDVRSKLLTPATPAPTRRRKAAAK